jgi:hypothetical protein
MFNSHARIGMSSISYFGCGKRHVGGINAGWSDSW